jgi:hypothetical protein
MIWGSIGSGYCIYGWRQKSLIPFLGGLAMTAAACFPMSVLLMSFICFAIMFAVYWLARQGY